MIEQTANTFNNDYPYQSTAPAVSFIEKAPLSETEREKIAHGNAERI
jgi:predicted TIM-barrel fold metal-dependent hydrolase